MASFSSVAVPSMKSRSSPNPFSCRISRHGFLHHTRRTYVGIYSWERCMGLFESSSINADLSASSDLPFVVPGNPRRASLSSTGGVGCPVLCFDLGS